MIAIYFDAGETLIAVVFSGNPNLPAIAKLFNEYINNVFLLSNIYK